MIWFKYNRQKNLDSVVVHICCSFTAASFITFWESLDILNIRQSAEICEKIMGTSKILFMITWVANQDTPPWKNMNKWIIRIFHIQKLDIAATWALVPGSNWAIFYVFASMQNINFRTWTIKLAWKYPVESLHLYSL